MHVDFLWRPARSTKRVLRPDRAAPSARSYRPWVDVVRERVQLARCRPAEQRGQHRLGDAGELADRLDAAGSQLRRRHRPDAPDALHRQRMEEGQLALRRHDEHAVRLRERAGHLREELRAGDADADRQPDALADRAAEANGDLCRCAGDSFHAPDVEERLIDRESLDEWSRVVEDGVQRLARFRVGRHPWPNDNGLGTEPARLPAAHRRTDSVGLGLVARGEHHAAADDHGTAAQTGIVALLDRREERVCVGVEDRRSTRHEHMFA